MKSTGRASRGHPALSLVPLAGFAGGARATAMRAATSHAPAAREDAAALPSDVPPIRRIAVEQEGRLLFVPLAEVQCIEARGDLIVIHTAGHSHLVRATLQAMQSRLTGNVFLRIHRSILVNSDSIAQMERTPRGDFILTLANGQRYASSASHRQVLLEFIRHCRP